MALGGKWACGICCRESGECGSCSIRLIGRLLSPGEIVEHMVGARVVRIGGEDLGERFDRRRQADRAGFAEAAEVQRFGPTRIVSEDARRRRRGLPAKLPRW